VKIARIGTVTIPDGQKLPELDDTFTILESYWQQYLMLCRYQVIPIDKRFIRYCLILIRIGKYCLVLFCIGKYWRSIVRSLPKSGILKGA
jgi:hypothetical protein